MFRPATNHRGRRHNRQEQSVINKQKAVQERIEHIEDALEKAREYLETGANANWHGFRPMFNEKTAQDGTEAPPHRDWVKNVFIFRCEQALLDAKKALRTIEYRRA